MEKYLVMSVSFLTTLRIAKLSIIGTAEIRVALLLLCMACSCYVCAPGSIGGEGHLSLSPSLSAQGSMQTIDKDSTKTRRLG